MKTLIIAALALAGCSTVSVNGMDLARVTALGTISAVGIALIVLHHDHEGGQDANFNCPTCPPTTKVD